jgi:hypothetical protein
VQAVKTDESKVTAHAVKAEDNKSTKNDNSTSEQTKNVELT